MGRRPRRWPYFLPPLALTVILLLWARSYLPDHTFIRFHRGRVALFFAGGNGAHRFDPADPSYVNTADAIGYCRRIAKVQGTPVGGVGAFEWIGINFKSDYTCALLVPFWAAALPTLGASVGAWLAHRRRRDRDRPGHCNACGYDLKGNVSGVCPECGAATAQAAA